MMRRLFIGGPWHGETHDIPENVQEWLVPVHAEPAIDWSREDPRVSEVRAKACLYIGQRLVLFGRTTLVMVDSRTTNEARDATMASLFLTPLAREVLSWG
jgi:hypothetical protein